MNAALFRQCMDTLCCGIRWSAADAASFLTNLEGYPPKRETVRDWLIRDSVPAWVWPQVRKRIAGQMAALAKVTGKLPAS